MIKNKSLACTPVIILDYGYNSKGELNETKVYSIHTDHLGTPKAITNQNQETVWSIEMDAFGETKSIESKNNFQFNLRFAGQYFDQETGYHYNYHRYYDPKVGRYLTSDPIGLNGGSLNTCAYVDGMPWAGVDPSGLIRWKGTSLTLSASIGAGIVRERYTLWSECVRGRKGFVVVDTDGNIFGPGSPVTFTGSSIELFDNQRDINFDSFNGDYVKMGYGFGLTFGNSEVQIGKAKTKTNLWDPRDVSMGAGLDLGASVVVGLASVIKKSYGECGC